MSDNEPGKPNSTVFKIFGNSGTTVAKKGPTNDNGCLNKGDDPGAVAQDKEEISDNRCLQSHEESRTTLKVQSKNAGSLQGRLGMHMQYLCIS